MTTTAAQPDSFQPRRATLGAIALGAMILGLCPGLLLGFYHDDFGIARGTLSHSWWEVFEVRSLGADYHYNPGRLVACLIVVGLAGPAPWAFHLLSLLSQAACLVAWYLVAARLCRSWIARLCLAGVFCFLPVVDEAVLWVGANDQVMGTAAYLWALWGFLRFREDGDRRWMIFSLATCAAGMFTNEMVVTLPAVLVLANLFPRAWGLTPSSRGRRWLWLYGVLTAVFVALHFAAVNLQTLRASGYTMSLGPHNLANLLYAGKAALLSPTLLHRAGARWFWAAFNDPSLSILLALACGIGFLAMITLRRTRILSLWLVLSLLPYTLTSGSPQAARYYHLPAAIVLFAAAAVLGSAAERWSWCQWPIAGISLLWFWSCYSVWLGGDVPFHQTMCDQADTTIDRVLRQVPDEITPNNAVVVFNDAPFAVRHTLPDAVDLALLARSHSRPAGVVYFSDIERYWATNAEASLGSMEVDAALSLTLICANPPEDPYELDGASPIARPCYRTKDEIRWNAKLPFPGFIVWRYKGGSGASPACDMKVILEEYPPDRHSTQPGRVSSWPLAFPGGRVRLPRPLDGHAWARLRVIGASCLEFDLLRLEGI